MKFGTLSSSDWGKLTRRWFAKKRQQLKKGALRVETLEARLALALTPTDDILPNLQILIDGQKVTIPANVGVQSNGTKSNPFTQDTSGNLHIGEGTANAGSPASSTPRLATLDDFFDVWREVGNGASSNPNSIFSSTQILDRTVDATHTIRMYVNGAVNTQFESYVPQDRDQIVISYEATTAAGTPTLAPIDTQTLLAGSPLYIPLNGLDPESQSLTYTVTSSNPSLVSTYIPTSNPSLKVTVENYGDMIFQLFQDKAPRPVQRVVTLANQGFYNGLTFHRILNNFVIQGGDPNGTGTGGSSLGNFDDQFNVDLQHNRSGLLSFAKTTDDTNNSQFFITEGAQRHLDFNHSIFGMLVQGENVRDQVSNVATNSQGTPNTTVTMSSVTVFQDTQNGVLMLKAAEGATGTAQITVTATDTQGNSFQRVFTVNVTPDTNNAPPFLQDITPVSIRTGQTSTFQLPAVDAENNPIVYEVLKQGSQTSYDLSVNSTGLVSITPPTGFTGTLQIIARVKSNGTSSNSSNPNLDQYDSQLLNISVLPAVNLAVDLAAGSDSGTSDSDNITNATTLNFTVSGMNSGDVIRLYSGSTLIGEQTATGTSASFAANNLTEGVQSITAKLVTNGVESNPSSPLSVTIDRTAPEDFTTTAPSLATATELYSYDVDHPDEAAQKIRYGLTSVPGAPSQLPSGMTIDQLTGEIAWTPTAGQTGAAFFRVTATDAAGNVRVADESVTVNEFVEAIVDIKLEAVDANGNVLTTIGVGETFFLRGSVRDRRVNPAGVFSYYADVTYDPAKVQTNGQLIYDSTFFISSGRSGDISTPGLIDEVGAIAQPFPTDPPDNEYHMLFRIEMKALTAGELRFEADPADIAAHKVLVRDLPAAPVTPLQNRFLGTTVEVASNFTAVDDVASIPEDSVNFSLAVLNNDTSRAGTTNTLTITTLGTPSHGTATISSDGKTVIYTPTTDFTGQDVFTYTVKNQNNETDTATITVNVTPTNDNPVAVNDAFTATEDSPRDMDVLANDLLGVDSGESLKVKSVSAGSAGGVITINSGGGSVRYTPKANFFGTETFTYVLDDGNGGEATGTVTVTVTPVNDNPTAVNDSQSVQEDSSSVSVNVLLNDSSSPDATETLTITAVGTPSRGGTVTIAADGKSVLYTPAANFFGEETFTYTISDGNGGTATAQVSMNVVNTNDAPTVVNDTVTGYKNTTDFVFSNLLNNDSSAPDPTENLVISSASAGSQGGTLKVSADGKSVLYTPATNFVGTETFTYTVRDPGGLTSTATVTVNVQNFIPSNLSGRVYIDSNKSGAYDAGEAPIGNVLITLTGTADGNQAVNTTLRTNADGTYSFTNLAPGTYTIKQSQPAFMDDGRETVGSQGSDGTTVNDQIIVTLAQNTNGTDNNFGEYGMPLTLFRVPDLFAKRQRNFVTAAVGTTNTTSWGLPSGAWSQYTSQTLSLTSDGKSVKVQVTDESNATQETTVALTDTARIQQLQEANGQKLVRLLGAPSLFSFTSSGGSNGATNTSPTLTVTNSSIAYTENGTLNIDAGILVNDADSANLTGATVSISTNFNAAEDVLEFTNQNGISGSYNSATGVLTLTGSASVANYQAALRAVTYRNSNDNPAVAGRTIAFQVNDGASTSNLSTVVTRLVTITTVNDAPIATTTSGGTTFTAGGAAVAVDAGFTVSDVDSTVLTGATITISNFISGQDSLQFTDQNGIAGSFNSSTGVLTLSGNSSLANYQTAVRSVKYANSASSPNTAARALSIVVTDGAGSNSTSAAAQKSILFAGAGSNTAPTLTMSAGAAGTYVENGADVTVDPGLTLTDSDSTTIAGATVSITANFSAAQDRLIFTNQNGISGSYNDTTGVLTLTGSATIAQYQTALRSIVYRNTSEAPTDAARTISFVVNDGAASNNLSVTATRTVNLDPVNDAPAVTIASTALNFAEGDADKAIDDSITVADVDSANLTGATIAIGTGFAGTEDQLIFTDQNGITGSYNASTGTLALSGSATVANYQTALRSVLYRNTSNSPTAGARTITVVVGDGGAENNASAVVSRTINVTATNDAPILTATSGALAYAEGAAATSVDAGLSVVDAEDNSLTAATVSFASGYQNGQDTLEYTAVNGITGTFNASTGKLELTGTATAAQYQEALRSVKYVNSSNTPVTTPRTVTFQVTDNGSPAANSSPAARVINVSAVNDAPVITAANTANTTTGTDIVFSAANGNQISIADVDAGTTDVSVTLTVTHGTLDLADVTGLTFTTGDGTGDATMTFSGSLSAINAALAVVVFHPETGYVGAAEFDITVSDLGHSGSGGAQTDSSVVDLAIAASGGGGEGEFASTADDFFAGFDG